MSGAVCQNFMACGKHTNDASVPKCERRDCPGKQQTFAPFKPATPPDMGREQA